MFVFKAAVVGAGTMGGQIAQTIAAAGIDVVLKDVKQELIDHGIEEARNVTAGSVAKLVEKGKLTQEEADAQVAEVLGRIHGTLTYDGFGDVDAGFHYFYPAAVMPLIEIVEGEDTAPETTQALSNFAQAIKKQPITCLEVPGFVVNRILNSGVCEVWRTQEEQGLSIQKIDAAVAEAKAAPMGPFFLVDLLGLDTVLHVAEHLHESYGDRFYIHQGMKKLVAEGMLGAKTGGSGFYANGEPQIPGDGEPDGDALVEIFTSKAFVEACLVLEEGIASHRDIDVGMMAGAGLDPRRGLFPPFMKADQIGLDVVLETLERLTEQHGERFAPPVVLRRLVAQGRLGTKTGQGFYPYPNFDAEQPGEVVKLETRGDVAIAWLANAPMNSISPQVIGDLGKVWAKVKETGVRALVLASSNPLLFCAGADIKAFTQMDEAGGQQLLDGAHGLFRELELSNIVTIAAVNGLAFGGGCEIAMACDVRLAAHSAIFGQPEIKLGIIPGFGGTQRLPRLVGPNKALEMNLIGDAVGAGEAYEFGLVNRVVPDHELLDTALAWARRLAEQAPIAVEQIKRVSFKADLDEGIEAEKAGFAAAFGSEDGKEGISAFLAKRKPNWQGN